jgi:hypothetical protein
MKKGGWLLAAVGALFVLQWSGLPSVAAEEVKRSEVSVQPDLFSRDIALSSQDLDELRGGESANFDLVSKMGLSGDLDNNVVNDGLSGDNVISDWSFSGTNGFATVIQNSGNNVLIQTTTTVNVITGP